MNIGTTEKNATLFNNLRLARGCYFTAARLNCFDMLAYVTALQCRIKLLGALCQTQIGAPVLCHVLVPIPAVSLTASRLKWCLVPIDIMMTSALILTI